MNGFEAALQARFAARARGNHSLAAFTSFRIGGPADFVVEVAEEAELSDALGLAARFEVPTFCLGAGTNILVSDRGVRGLVICLGPGLRRIDFDGTRVVAGAGAQFGALVRQAVARGLAGLEFGEGIPGTVGGALIMNAGAFGGEMARVVRLVQGVAADGQRRVISQADVGFSYRKSGLPAGFVVSAVHFELEPGERAALQARVADLAAKRSARQPKGLPNAGSVFKNPPGTFAGRLLERCGLKGQRVGDAAFSEQHANFIVNLGQARAIEVRTLMDLARRRVEEQTGIRLEPELRLVGEW